MKACWAASSSDGCVVPLNGVTDTNDMPMSRCTSMGAKVGKMEGIGVGDRDLLVGDWVKGILLG